MAGQFNRTKLMWASFLTLVASGVGFATRTAAGGPWEAEFGIDSQQFGQILGAGFLGFGVMILLGGLLVETFGYRLMLGVAFVLHLVSAAMLFLAPPLFEGWRESSPDDATEKVFQLLRASAFLFSLCQGLYEAVINPLIAQLYPENKTHYLNILHAGWPAGMIVGGLFAAGFIGRDCWFVELPWQVALSSFALIVVAYGILALPEKFPATVAESSGGIGLLFSCFASPIFILLIFLHGCIGYVELGVDSWVAKLMENLLPNAIIVLVYTSFLMFILRFFAGPVVHKINPIGLLLGSSIIGFAGLRWLGTEIDTVAMIFVAATFYSFGKAFWWPTMLGVAGERYPQSGAVAMGALGMAGALTVGLLGGPGIGAKVGYNMSANLKDNAPDTFERYADKEDSSFLGYTYKPIIAERLNAANGVQLNEDGSVKDAKSISEAKLLDDDVKKLLLDNAAEDVPKVKAANLYGGRRALTLTSYVPATMAVGFLIIVVYFASTGGYKVIELNGEGGGDSPGTGESGPGDADTGDHVADAGNGTSGSGDG